MYSLYFNTTIRGMAKGGQGTKKGIKGGGIIYFVYVILSIKQCYLG